jgi:DNA transposition AAA+ family ATPase
MKENEMEVAVDEELYEQFFALVGEGKRWSQSKAAKALDYSPGAVSAYKSRSYSGNIEAFEKAVREWLKREARRVAKIEVPVVETATLDSMRKALTMAQDESDIAVIVGDAGTGKTTALRAYATENRNAVLIEVDSTFTKNVLVAEIARAVGVEEKGSITAVVSRIVEALRERDAVVMIGGAGYLSDSSLEPVRRVINDKAQTGAALRGLPDAEVIAAAGEMLMG